MDLVPATVKFFLLAAAVMTTACSAPPEPTRRNNVAPLTQTFDTAEALARSVLEGLSQSDLQRLSGLPLSEAEFRDHVWPELPASRPERNVPFEYAWGQMKQRSDGSMHQTFARYGGKHLLLVRTRFSGETTQYESFKVMRESEIIATDETGRELVLRLYGSAMVTGGRFKLFSYVVDE